jgi:TRAP transporter TAXI family solute receptor
MTLTTTRLAVAWTVFLLLLALMLTIGCTRGADEARLEADVQARLDRDVKPGLFRIVGLQREGSAPLPAGESGVPRVVVYFNTTLALAEDYSFGGWEQLGASSVAFALGATERGLVGVQAENRKGDLIRAYGSAVYERSDAGWTPAAAVASSAAPAPDFEGTAPPSRSKQLIDRLAAMVELPPPGVPPQQDAIIAEELARASENIERRVQRREHAFTIASGPAGGEYARFTDALIATITQINPALRLRARTSDGSVENARLLAEGGADYALVQSDVAAAAVAGEGPFAGRTLDALRAVGGLFPETLHLVVRADSPLHDVAHLRGRRVDIGPPASGTRFDALAVLAARGLGPVDLREARGDDPASAFARLRRGQLDAVFLTAAAPSRSLQQLAAGTPVRLLPIDGDTLESVMHARPGLTPLRLPPNTYPSQTAPVPTLAAVALLVTTTEAPLLEVERVYDLLFTQLPQRAVEGGLLKISPANALRGVTIPLHPGAARPTDAGDR